MNIYSRNNLHSLPDENEKTIDALKNLLMVAPYFPPHLGGQENYSYNISKILQSDFHWQVVVATTGSKGLRLSKTTIDDLMVYQLPYWFKISNTPINPFYYFQLRSIIRRHNIDIIDAHAPVPTFADIAIRASRRVPVVLTYHMQSMRKQKPSLDWIIWMYENLLLPFSLRKVDSIICSSNIVREDFLQNFIDKSYTVFPGVDTNLFKPSARKSDKKSLLYVGSLHKNDTHKGVKYLLEAMAFVVKEHPNSELHLIGDGSGREEFEQMAVRLGIEKNVNFHGELSGADLAKQYQSATLFTFPSFNESVGMVLLEAMASGIPIISTNAGGIPDVVEHKKAGYLVTPKNSRELAQKIVYVLNKPEIGRKLGLYGRQKVESNLTWPAQAQKTHSILRATLIGTRAEL